MRIGYFLSSEEYSPAELIQSPFVWSMIGAISQVCALSVTTAVTCEEP